MGHTHGILWTDDLIKEKIEYVMTMLEIDRMPSDSECKFATGNGALSNKISKTGGFYFWANKLELDVKNCETKLGINHEESMLKEIQKKYNAELTTVKFPYDILVEGMVKIDVKYSNLYSYSHGEYYSFNLEQSLPKSDILILICENKKTLIIPSHKVNGLTQVSVGTTSKYDEYIGKWEYLDKFISFYKSI